VREIGDGVGVRAEQNELRRLVAVHVRALAHCQPQVWRLCVPRVDAKRTIDGTACSVEIAAEEKELRAQKVDVCVWVVHLDTLREVGQRVLILLKPRVRERAVHPQRALARNEIQCLRQQRRGATVRPVLEQAHGAQVEDVRQSIRVPRGSYLGRLNGATIGSVLLLLLLLLLLPMPRCIGCLDAQLVRLAQICDRGLQIAHS
jgi:hypothetical protein